MLLNPSAADLRKQRGSSDRRSADGWPGHRGSDGAAIGLGRWSRVLADNRSRRQLALMNLGSKRSRYRCGRQRLSWQRARARSTGFACRPRMSRGFESSRRPNNRRSRRNGRPALSCRYLRPIRQCEQIAVERCNTGLAARRSIWYTNHSNSRNACTSCWCRARVRVSDLIPRRLRQRAFFPVGNGISGSERLKIGSRCAHHRLMVIVAERHNCRRAEGNTARSLRSYCRSPSRPALVWCPS